MGECIFCQIAEKKRPSRIICEDDRAIVVEDINPQAPIHALIIPKKHIASLDGAQEDDQPLLGYLLLLAQKVARLKKIERSGYRVLTNHGRGAGQSVFHIHFHLLGGRPMLWPPG